MKGPSEHEKRKHERDEEKVKSEFKTAGDNYEKEGTERSGEKSREAERRERRERSEVSVELLAPVRESDKERRMEEM